MSSADEFLHGAIDDTAFIFIFFIGGWIGPDDEFPPGAFDEFPFGAIDEFPPDAFDLTPIEGVRSFEAFDRYVKQTKNYARYIKIQISEEIRRLGAWG